VDVNRQAAAVRVVCAVKKLLEQLRVQDADKEVETAVIIGYDDKQRGLRSAEAGCGGSRTRRQRVGRSYGVLLSWPDQ